MTKLLYIDPVGTAVAATGIADTLREAKAPETAADLVTLPEDRPDHLEYHSYEAVVVQDIVHHVHAGRDKYDGFIIGCFYDLALHEAREVSGNATVVAPCEASTAVARMLGHRFSVIVGRRKWIPKMMENVRRYGHGDAIASMRPVDIGVREFHARNDTADRLTEVGRTCVEDDGAEVLILGCTAEYGFRENLERELGVPVIDPVQASVAMAEFLATQADRLGWRPSRKGGSEAPPAHEIADWRLYQGPPPTGTTLTIAASAEA